jgi:hypothetical protein
MSGANAVRGEASLRVGGEALVLRPSFAALVAAEAEIGSLFGLVERAAGANSDWPRWSRCSGIACRMRQPA